MINAFNGVNKTKNKLPNYSTKYKVEFNRFTLDKNNYVEYANDFILLNEEIFSLFNSLNQSNNFSVNYILGDDKIFIINNSQNVILIYNIDNKDTLKLELIFHLDCDIKYILSLIKEISFSNFKQKVFNVCIWSVSHILTK